MVFHSWQITLGNVLKLSSHTGIQPYRLSVKNSVKSRSTPW
jgi:hypothetical protein